jgi:hypothetical protein
MYPACRRGFPTRSAGWQPGCAPVYTDHDEVLFDAIRPVILNGIEDIGTHMAVAGSRTRVAEDTRSPRPLVVLKSTFANGVS